jgi:hypothetical protein
MAKKVLKLNTILVLQLVLLDFLTGKNVEFSLLIHFKFTNPFTSLHRF